MKHFFLFKENETKEGKAKRKEKKRERKKDREKNYPLERLDTEIRQRKAGKEQPCVALGNLLAVIGLFLACPPN